MKYKAKVTANVEMIVTISEDTGDMVIDEILETTEIIEFDVKHKID